ncbi:hypothetical protein [Streptomyces sp. NPDC096324]
MTSGWLGDPDRPDAPSGRGRTDDAGHAEGADPCGSTPSTT